MSLRKNREAVCNERLRAELLLCDSNTIFKNINTMFLHLYFIFFVALSKISFILRKYQIRISYHYVRNDFFKTIF